MNENRKETEKFLFLLEIMFVPKSRSGTKINSNINGDETIRRVTREKIVVRGNKTIRTLDSTTSFLPVIERYVERVYYLGYFFFGNLVNIFSLQTFVKTLKSISRRFLIEYERFCTETCNLRTRIIYSIKR